MKAAVFTGYGTADVVQIQDLEKPVPKDNEVLIKVRAASLNPLDWRIMGGEPRILRIFTGLKKPKIRPGRDVSGEIEEVGKNITQFKPGDEVFGGCRGAVAEYAVTSELALVRKPQNVTFEEAASVFVAGLTAVQGLRNKGQIQPGEKVLISGAAGGVGTFAVQFAKLFGAEVTGVCSTSKLEMVRSIGADHVIDYTQEDFTKTGQHYDLILDCAAVHSLSAIKGILNPKGRYVVIGEPGTPSMLNILTMLARSFFSSRFSDKKMIIFMAKLSQDDLNLMADWMTAGKMKPVIDRCYPFKEVSQAMAYLEEGHPRGKVIVTVP